MRLGRHVHTPLTLSVSRYLGVLVPQLAFVDAIENQSVNLKFPHPISFHGRSSFPATPTPTYKHRRILIVPSIVPYAFVPSRSM